MDCPDLASDQICHLGPTGVAGDEINGLVAEWTASMSGSDITARCVEHDVPVGTAYSAADIFLTPTWPSAATWWRSKTRSSAQCASKPPTPAAPTSDSVPSGAPRLGEHNRGGVA